MKLSHRRILFLAAGCAAVLACTAISSSDMSDSDSLSMLRQAYTATDGGADVWIDCVGVLDVVELRGVDVSNAWRFGEDASALRTTARLGELAPAQARAFCDWEACIRANGYGHVCALNDAGWESCRVCSTAADCDGRPMSPEECVAHASDVGRAACHVGLLQECLLQQAIRGPADPRTTRTCRWSAQACAGELAGDRSAEAMAAQHETDQVAVEQMNAEVAAIAATDAAPGYVNEWREILSGWDGGLPPDDDAFDAGLPDAAAGD